MDAGHIPFVAADAIIVALAAFVIMAGLLLLRARAATYAIRGLTCGLVAIAFLLSPVAFHLLIEPRLAAAARQGMYIDPSPLLGWLPSLFAALLLTLTSLLFPTREGHRTATWRAAYAAVAFAFVLVNVTNSCRPGWCGRYGVPFVYYEWSDAVIMGEHPQFNRIGFLSNFVVFAAVSAGLSFLYRRGAVAATPGVRGAAGSS